MPSAKTQPARGMRDFLPEDVRKREYVIRVIKDVYERYGFEPLETPAAENIETLLGKYGEEGNQLIFKILKRGVHEATGEADLALRYDLTVPLARVVAERRDKLPKFFKRYQIQPVWRADRPARGRFREFYQCDVDVIGSRSVIVEAEICAAASEVLMKLSFVNFTIHLNHRGVLKALLDSVDIPAQDQITVLTILDKLGKIGIEGVRKEFSQRGLPQHACNYLLDFFSRVDQNAVDVFDLGADETHHPTEVDIEKWNNYSLAEMKAFVTGHKEGEHALNELESILKLTDASHAKGRVAFAPNLARGLSYYTGAIMEVTAPGLLGSLGGGGRYDNLIGMFSGKNIPACGFSLGLERILVVMSEKDMFPPYIARTSIDVLIASLGETFASYVLYFSSYLRHHGFRVSFYPDLNTKPQKCITYADQLGIPIVVLFGEEEYSQGVITVRNVVDRQQERPDIQIARNVIEDMLLAARRTQEIDEKVLQKSYSLTRAWLKGDDA